MPIGVADSSGCRSVGSPAILELRPGGATIDKLLLIDAEPDRSEDLEDLLRNAKFDVARRAESEDAVRVALAERPALVVFDLPWTLDQRLDLARKVRYALGEPRLPVLLIGRDEERVLKAVALEEGADDLIVRPYDARELLARIRALLRITSAGAEAGPLTAGPIAIDRERITAQVGGEDIRLTWKEFELLRVLMEARGRVVRRETLTDKVWGYRVEVESRTIDVHVRRLRQKLGAEGRRIITLRGVGYRMEFSPEWVEFGR